jgi:WD40 repeat protein
MTQLDFGRVRKLIELVHDASPSERELILDRECGSDIALRAEVEALLHAAAASPEFLTRSTALPRAEELIRELDAGSHDELERDARVGGFRLVRRIASGGMGTVWEAEQDEPRRKVALKTMRFANSSRESVRRFRHESEILARLRHPNVAQVFASGVHALPGGKSLPWYALEFVEDSRTLLEFARERGLGLRGRLELFATLCDAVQHGHERGVIHRDLKPSNVLVDRAGTLKVIDFGIARVREFGADQSSLHTEAGRVIGTLQYMAPEQISGSSDGLDTRSDVYALGVLLYELVTDQLPYDLSRASLASAARVLIDETPQRPSARGIRISADLDAITLKALEKDRERRYASAAALGQDVRRHLHGDPVEARTPSVGYQLRAFARRNRTLVGVVGAVLITLVVAAPISTWLAWRATHAEELAVGSATEARTQRDEARFREYGAEIAAAYGALRGHDANLARQHLDRCAESARGFEWWMLDRRVDPSLWTRACDGSNFAGLAWHPDGSRIFVGTESGSVEVRDPQSGETLAACDLGDTLRGLVLDADGRNLVGLVHADICRIDPDSLAVLQRWPAHERAVVCATFTPGGRTLISAGLGGDVVEWEFDGGRRLREFERVRAQVWCLTTSADLRWLAGGTAATNQVIVWDYATGAIVHRLDGHEGYVSSVAFDRDSSVLASSSHDHTLRFWDPCTGELRSVLRGHEDIVMRLAFDATSERLASGGWDRTIRLWDPGDGRMLATLSGAGGNIGPLAFSPDGTRVVAGDSTSHVKLWNVAAPDPDVVQMRGKWLWKLRFWPDGRSVLAVHGGYAHRYATASDRVLATYPVRQAEWRGADVAPDGESIALGASNGRLEVLDADGARVLASATAGSRALLALDWSDDGLRLAGGSEDGSVFVFEGPERAARKLADAGTPVRAVSFAPRSGQLAFVGVHGELRVVDGGSGALSWSGAPCFSPALDIAWSPDGARIAVALEDGRVMLWNAATHLCERELIGHTAAVNAVAFAPDGARLASGSNDRSIRLWEPNTGREVANLIDHAYFVDALAFTPDGSTLVSGSSDSTLRWWRARDAAERVLAQGARRLFLGREVRAALARDTELDPRTRARALALSEGLVDDPSELGREAWIAAAEPSSDPLALHDAAARAEIALRYRPDDAKALRALAAARMRLGETDAALELLADRLKSAPDDAVAHVLHALALLRADRGDEARAELALVGSPARVDADLSKLLAEAKSVLGAQSP